MYRKVCTKAAACAVGIMVAGGVSVVTKENSIRNVAASSPYYRYVTASALNIRTGASINYTRVGLYQRGTKVACYGTSGNWTKVKYSGEIRYVCSDYLSAAAPDTNTSTYSRYVTASALNVRSGASMSASVVGSYQRGAKVTCYGTSGSWTKVKYNGTTRYVSTQYLSTTAPDTNTSTYSRYVTASALNVRSGASMSASVVGSYKKGTKVTCYGTSGSWTKVNYNGATRYVSTQYLSATAPSTSGSNSTGSNSNSNSITNSVSKGQQVANYALQFVGNPYVYGGTSLTNGADCSGFTQSVYKHFGYSIPRTSSAQRSAGRAVSWADRQVGDLICYSGHVAIYIGNNKIVHASNSKDGIKITYPANYTTVLSVRRIVD